MSLRLRTRSEGQIRERFINVLKPEKRIMEWTDRETKLLLENATNFKYKWAKLSELFEHKSDNEVWRKFRSLVAEKSLEDINELIHDDKILKAVIEYKHKNKIQTRNLGEPTKQVKYK